MARPARTQSTGLPVAGAGLGLLDRPEPASLADVLERVLDKGIVIAGDIRVDLVSVELLTIRIRLLIASVDRAREMGIDWWERDPMFSSRARAEIASEAVRHPDRHREPHPSDGHREADHPNGHREADRD